MGQVVLQDKIMPRITVAHNDRIHPLGFTYSFCVGGGGLYSPLSSFRILMAALMATRPSGTLLAAMFEGREHGEPGTGSSLL